MPPVMEMAPGVVAAVPVDSEIAPAGPVAPPDATVRAPESPDVVAVPVLRTTAGDVLPAGVVCEHK